MNFCLMYNKQREDWEEKSSNKETMKWKIIIWFYIFCIAYNHDNIAYRLAVTLHEWKLKGLSGWNCV